MSVSEGWPELAESDPGFVGDTYEGASENPRAVLEALAECAPERLSYAELAERLHWPRSRWPGVFGSYKGPGGEWSRRPFHLCPPDQSPRGEWEIWMDQAQADAINAAASRG